MNAAAYARFSSDNQREESIDAQLRAIEKYAQSENISLVKTYVDYAISGSTDERGQFQQMFKDAERGLFDCVIVHKLDRFTRNQRDLLNYEYQLQQNNIKLISVTELTDDTSSGFLLKGMKGVINHFYLLNLSEEVKKGLRENAYQAMTTGGRPPLGYDIDSDKKYVINEYEAQAVKLIYELYANGKSYREISDVLNQKGYKTKRGNRFAPNSLIDLISNEKYKGQYVFNKRSDKHNKHSYTPEAERIVIEDGVPRIVTDYLWNKANSRRNIRTRGHNKAKHSYLLAGLIECGECGSSVSGYSAPNRSTGKTYLGYRCNGRKKYNQCKLPTVSARKLENMVIAYLKQTILNIESADQISSEIYKGLCDIKKNSPDEIKILKKQLKKLDGKINNIVTAIAEGWAKETLKEELNRLETEKSALIAQLKSMDPEKLNDIPSKANIKDFIIKSIKLLDGSDEEKKYIIRLFVQKIILYADKSLKVVSIMTNDGTGLGVPNK